MVKRNRGRPIITLRLDAPRIAALKMAADKHGLTVSDLLRQLIEYQLKQDGITISSDPLPGQMTM